MTVYVDRKDGLQAPIRLTLKDAPKGISASPTFITGTQPVAQLTIKAGPDSPTGPFDLVVEGKATVGSDEIVRQAVPSEDRMQAFLWRHLVPTQDLKAYVFDPSVDVSKPRRKRDSAAAAAVATDGAAGKAKFTKAQVAGRLRQLDRLFDEGLLSPEFYHKKLAECGVTE